MKIYLRKVERADLWIYSNMAQALADVARGARLVASATTCRWRLQAANYCRRIMSCIPNTYITELIEFYIHTSSIPPNLGSSAKKCPPLRRYITIPCNGTLTSPRRAMTPT
jgi:hypothetical protein